MGRDPGPAILAGIDHVADAVTGLESAAATVQERGIGLAHEEPVEGYFGRLLTQAPADTVVPTQLVEPAAD